MSIAMLLGGLECVLVGSYKLLRHTLTVKKDKSEYKGGLKKIILGVGFMLGSIVLFNIWRC
jgi:hypothetical protein